MIVKSDRKSLIAVWFLIGCCILFSVLFYLVFPYTFAATAFLLITGTLCVRQWIVVGRTFEFNKDGIVVSFLWIRRMYNWSDIKTKQYMNYKNMYGYKELHWEGIEFSRKKLKNRKILKCAEYGVLKHPFSFVFVYFSLDEYPILHNGCISLYVVDKKTFLERMNEWDIMIDGYGA